MGIAGPEGLLRHYRLDAEAMAAYAGAGALNRDSFPILEFLAPYGLYGHYFDAFRSLAFARPTPIGPGLLSRGDPALAGRALERQEMFGAWLRLEAESQRLRESGGEHALPRDSLEDMKRLARGLGKGEDPWLTEKANRLAVGFFGAAAAGPTVGATLASGLIHLAKQAEPAAKLGYLEEASPFAAEAPRPALEAALLWIELKGPARAGAILRGALAKTPGDARLLQILGVALAEEKKVDAAIATFAKALASTKDAVLRSEIHFNASWAHHLAGRREDALRECELALRENPQNEMARKRLEEIKKAPPGAGGR
jgi:tetratricopeptide (TPR) repeat protein